ncbi:hypothetical protein SAMN06265222_11330 [Neorhodopirellula lusitana]|uniref:Uncharacterized protein n=1 Tax=Neorhodopirellula lusitana TaxID=445327 RepID=A0ABY1QII3_9BACT|nr:hypothetical protein SAMN06265222_11330 [Neorhodopirellula lusitana]
MLVEATIADHKARRLKAADPVADETCTNEAVTYVNKVAVKNAVVMESNEDIAGMSLAVAAMRRAVADPNLAIAVIRLVAVDQGTQAKAEEVRGVTSVAVAVVQKWAAANKKVLADKDVNTKECSEGIANAKMARREFVLAANVQRDHVRMDSVLKVLAAKANVNLASNVVVSMLKTDTLAMLNMGTLNTDTLATHMVTWPTTVSRTRRPRSRCR